MFYAVCFIQTKSLVQQHDLPGCVSAISGRPLLNMTIVVLGYSLRTLRVTRKK